MSRLYDRIVDSSYRTGFPIIREEIHQFFGSVVVVADNVGTYYNAYYHQANSNNGNLFEWWITLPLSVPPFERMFLEIKDVRPFPYKCMGMEILKVKKSILNPDYKGPITYYDDTEEMLLCRFFG